MRLTDYEKAAQREIDTWQRDESPLQKAINVTLSPVDWLFKKAIPDEVVDQISNALNEALGALNNASEYTFEAQDILDAAEQFDLEVDTVEALREQPLDRLDELARSFFSQNTILAALSGGGTGLGGPLLIAADVPILFTINFRLIQQIGASYGFELKDEAFKPLLLAIFNVAAAGTKDAKSTAMRELSVAAAAFAHGGGYRGRRASSTFRDQIGHLPREIAKNLAGRKLGQLIPIAGAAVGAGVNYWFTEQTAKTAYMLFRSLYLERKDRM
ncbi:MAG: EcsC family protein [Bacteroidota bacterium]